MAVSTAKAVWSVCVPICRPLSADVKEYAQRIDCPVREFVSSLRPDCKRGIDPLPTNRIRCCRRHSCRQISADSNHSRYSGHQNRKGRRRKWGTAAMRAAQIMGCSCLRWVNRIVLAARRSLPVHPVERTSGDHCGMPKVPRADTKPQTTSNGRWKFGGGWPMRAPPMLSQAARSATSPRTAL